MKIVPLHTYVVKSKRDFVNFLSDLEKQGLKDRNTYLFKWVNDDTKFGDGGYSFCITEDFSVKWGDVLAKILMDLATIREYIQVSCSSEYKTYKLLYYSGTKLIKYNRS